MPSFGLSSEVMRYGSSEGLPERHKLRAGPLSLVYEAGDLRYIKLGDREVIRRIYAAVRDRNWATVPNRLSNVRIDSSEDSFHIEYDVENRQGEIDFAWRGEIDGDPAGQITFSFDGRANSTFLRNRIGFCVLHPIRECAGAACRVTHPDGQVIESRFPYDIDPNAPFVEIAAIAHEVQPGVWAKLEFAGDIFEMEDQRNWIDASFKTFCTPLRLPFPVEVAAGTKIHQTVTLSLETAAPLAISTRSERRVEFEVTSQTVGSLPAIGLQVASHGEPLSPREIERLTALSLAHLCVDLKLGESSWRDELARAGDQARSVGVSLEAAVFVTDDAEKELDELSRACSKLQPTIARWLLFHFRERSTTEKWVRLARKALGAIAPAATVISGTNANFCELNRGRPPIDVLGGVCYSAQPQEHAYDNASLVETLECLAATVESARQFTGNLPVFVTPITLRKRFNPYATGPEPPSAAGALPSQVDRRQMSLFGAAWTLGSLKYLAESRVAGVTYYETTGWRGVMETETGPPLPQQFSSLPDGVFPLYHVLADLGEMSGADVLRSRSSDTLRVDGLAIRAGGRLRVMIANFTDEAQQVRLCGLPGQLTIRTLDDSNAFDAMSEPESFRRQPGRMAKTTNGELTEALPPFSLLKVDCP
jgi:hypothetical protein